MMLGQRGAKKHTEQRASEDPHEHDETDCRDTHDPFLMAAPNRGPRPLHKQAGECEAPRCHPAAAILGACLALAEANAPCHASTPPRLPQSPRHWAPPVRSFRDQDPPRGG